MNPVAVYPATCKVGSYPSLSYPSLSTSTAHHIMHRNDPSRHQHCSPQDRNPPEPCRAEPKHVSHPNPSIRCAMHRVLSHVQSRLWLGSIDNLEHGSVPYIQWDPTQFHPLQPPIGRDDIVKRSRYIYSRYISYHMADTYPNIQQIIQQIHIQPTCGPDHEQGGNGARRVLQATACTHECCSHGVHCIILPYQLGLEC